MGALRLLLMATWAAWIWLELVVVVGPTLVDRLRGRGESRDSASAGVLVVCVAIAFWSAVRLARSPFGALPGPPAAAMGAGIALMWLGLTLQVWAVQHLGGPLRAVVVVRRDQRLVTTGPYRHVRHPLHTGALLAAAGFGLALGHWTSLLALVLGWVAGLAYRAHVEDAALREAFGPDYEKYRARTRRLIPLLY
jgi:protein-S-isoprenylcysteine O-methyltransferase Ste14